MLRPKGKKKNPKGHLEESVMVDILSHIVQVVVLAPGTDAFLRVHNPEQVPGRYAVCGVY